MRVPDSEAASLASMQPIDVTRLASERTISRSDIRVMLLVIQPPAALLKAQEREEQAVVLGRSWNSSCVVAGLGGSRPIG